MSLSLLAAFVYLAKMLGFSIFRVCRYPVEPAFTGNALLLPVGKQRMHRPLPG